MTGIALMGFGRIGRNLFRILYKRDDIRIVAISDTADPKALEYLLRFDTLLGRFPDVVSIKEGNLFVYGRPTRFLSGEEGETVRWDELGVDVVLEATARQLPRAALEKHIERGAKRVIQCSPAVEPLDMTVVRGVNDDALGPQHRVISSASSTVNCAAPILKILDEAFGIERVMFTTIHAYTNWHRLADVVADDMRRGRAAPENIIPQESRSPRMLDELLPELRGKITGAAMNVPVRNGSAVDLVTWHKQKVTVTAINEVMRTAAASRWAGVVSYVEDPIVSSDVARSDYSSNFDSLATMTLGERLSKTLSWYDAGWGYAQRVVELVERFSRMESAR